MKSFDAPPLLVSCLQEASISTIALGTRGPRALLIQQQLIEEPGAAREPVRLLRLLRLLAGDVAVAIGLMPQVIATDLHLRAFIHVPGLTAFAVRVRHRQGVPAR